MESLPSFVPFILFALSFLILIGVSGYLFFLLRRQEPRGQVSAPTWEFQATTASPRDRHPSVNAPPIPSQQPATEIGSAPLPSLDQQLATDNTRNPLQQAAPKNRWRGSASSQPLPADNAKLAPQSPLSGPERSFYDFLSRTINGQYIIQTRTPLNDLFSRYGWLDRGLYTMHTFGHADFVLLDRKTKKPVLAIELDDKSHERPERQDRDQRKDELFRRANLKLLRFRVGVHWGSKERQAILNALPSAPPRPSDAKSLS